MVEFAFCAPVFFLLVFFGIEVARVNLVMQTAESACVQGARRAIVPGATASDVESVTDSILNTSRISGYTVTLTPSVIDSSTDEVTVSVSVPLDGNGYVVPKFFSGKTVDRSVTFKRE